jgi:hypothetical protein
VRLVDYSPFQHREKLRQGAWVSRSMVAMQLYAGWEPQVGACPLEEGPVQEGALGLERAGLNEAAHANCKCGVPLNIGCANSQREA